MFVSFTLPFLLIGFLVAVWAVIFIIKKYFPAKATHWLVMIYVSILLLSVAIVMIGMEIKQPFKDGDTVRKVSEPGFQEEVYQAFKEGKDLEPFEKYVAMEKVFPLEPGVSVVKIEKTGKEGLPLTVFIKRNKENSGQIAAKVYSHAFQEVFGYQMTAAFPPPKLKWSKNQLSISAPKVQEVNLYFVNKEFPVHQFREKEKRDTGYTSWAWFVIYLQIPEHIQIEEGDNVFVEYL